MSTVKVERIIHTLEDIIRRLQHKFIGDIGCFYNFTICVEPLEAIQERGGEGYVSIKLLIRPYDEEMIIPWMDDLRTIAAEYPVDPSLMTFADGFLEFERDATGNICSYVDWFVPTGLDMYWRNTEWKRSTALKRSKSMPNMKTLDSSLTMALEDRMENDA